MPNVPENVRKSILQSLGEKKNNEEVEKERIIDPNTISKNISEQPSCSDSTDLASYLSKMNLFEETMNKQEIENKELDEAKSVYREKIQKEIMNDKSLNIIKLLDF